MMLKMRLAKNQVFFVCLGGFYVPSPVTLCLHLAEDAQVTTEQGILLHYQKIQNLGHKGTKIVFYQIFTLKVLHFKLMSNFKNIFQKNSAAFCQQLPSLNGSTSRLAENKPNSTNKWMHYLCEGERCMMHEYRCQ